MRCTAQLGSPSKPSWKVGSDPLPPGASVKASPPPGGKGPGKEAAPWSPSSIEQGSASDPDYFKLSLNSGLLPLSGADAGPNAAVSTTVQLHERRVPGTVRGRVHPAHANVRPLIRKSSLSVNLQLVGTSVGRRDGTRPVDQIVTFHDSAAALSIRLNDEFHVTNVFLSNRIPCFI